MINLKRGIEPVFRCGACKCTHDEYEDAQDCCPTLVTEVYVCPVCGEDYGDEQAAIKCHGLEPPDLQKPSAEELERHGKKRLEFV